MSTISLSRLKLRPAGSNNYLTSKASQYGYNPLIKGNMAPNFQLYNEDGIARHLTSGSLANEPVISLQDFLDFQKPLVLVFYNKPLGEVPDIMALKNLQANIEVMGGELVILTGTSPKYFKKVLRHKQSLTIFHDRDQAIAEQFGLYDAFNPLWQWVAGFEQEDFPLPAYYVITPDGEIAFHHIDYNLITLNEDILSQSFIRNLLTSVYQSSQQYNYHPLEYKFIS